MKAVSLLGITRLTRTPPCALPNWYSQQPKAHAYCTALSAPQTSFSCPCSLWPQLTGPKGSGKSAQLARNRRVAKHIGMEDGIAEAQEHATDAVSAANDDSEDVLVATRAAARSADDAELDAAFASRVGPGLTPPSAEASREYFDHAMRKRYLSATEIANGLLVATMKGLKSIGNALASVF